MANIICYVVNITNQLHTKKGRNVKQYKPIDFMPRWGEEKEEIYKQSVEQMKEALMAIANKQNKKVKLHQNPPKGL